MGCAVYLLAFFWLGGIFMTIGGFIVNPRSQAPIFYISGIIFLSIAIISTYIVVSKPKREAKRQANQRFQVQIALEQAQKELAHAEGLSKYHLMDIADVRKMREEAETIRKVGKIVQNSVYQEREKNWAVMGGIAEGIAGPAAGVATALNTMQDNARIQAENAERRRWGAEQRAMFDDLAKQAERGIHNIVTLEALQNKYDVVLSWAPSTLFDMFSFGTPEIKTDFETGAVSVSVSWKKEDTAVCIDGCLRAKLYSADGKCAGCAYLALPKTGAAGTFGSITGICARPKKSASYSVRIEPADLWELTLKGSQANIKNDNLTPDEHRKLVAESEARYQAELK